MPDPNPDLLNVLSDNNEDPVALLVGEGKKYKDVAALAASRLEADKFIEKLKEENAQLRNAGKELESKVNESVDIKALIERIDKAQSQNGNQPGTLSREDIEKLVAGGINKERSVSVRAGNRAASNAEVNTYFNGDSEKAKIHLKTRMDQLGLSGEALTEIAETNPKMFRELFVPANKQAGSSAASAGRKVDLSNGEAERGKSYYRDLRKQIGMKYFDPSIQQQLLKDRERLGDRFNQL